MRVHVSGKRFSFGNLIVQLIRAVSLNVNQEFQDAFRMSDDDVPRVRKHRDFRFRHGAFETTFCGCGIEHDVARADDGEDRYGDVP